MKNICCWQTTTTTKIMQVCVVMSVPLWGHPWQTLFLRDSNFAWGYHHWITLLYLFLWPSPYFKAIGALERLNCKIICVCLMYPLFSRLFTQHTHTHESIELKCYDLCLCFRHREGYAEGDYTLFHKLNATEFVRSDNFMEKLAACSMVGYITFMLV